MRSLRTSLNTAHSECKPSTFISLSHTLFSKSSHFSLYISLLPPPSFYRPIPQSSTLLCSRCPKPPQSATPHHIRHTLHTHNPHCTSYPSATPRTSTSPSSVPSSPGCADLLSSLPKFQSPYVNTFWTQALYIFPFIRYDAPWVPVPPKTIFNLVHAIS